MEYNFIKLTEHPDLVKRWCDFLRSDEFEKTRVSEKYVTRIDGEFCYCAIGHLYRLKGNEVIPAYGVEGYFMFDKYDIEFNFGSFERIADMNDSGVPGSEIADYVENEYA